jgi:hypothetical protein
VRHLKNPAEAGFFFLGLPLNSAMPAAASIFPYATCAFSVAVGENP